MRILVFAAALMAPACMPQAPQQQQQQQPSQTHQPNQTGAAAMPASPSAKPGADAAVQTTPILDRAFLVGRWGDNGDCSKDVTLNADGSFTSYTGGGGEWSLNGSTMRMVGKAETLAVEVDVIDQNTLRITNPNGSVGTSQRCT